jgi:hypothetical protein
MVLSIVFTGCIALAVAATAAGGGLSPGQYTFSGAGASAYFGAFKGGPPQPTFSVFVNRGLNSFEPENAEGSATVIETTMVYFTQFDSAGAGGFGCFIIPSADFTVSKDLQSAALHTTLTANNLCPGFAKPLVGGKTAPAAPGLGGGLPLPINVDVTWSGVGVTSTSKDEFSYRCLDRSTNGSSTFLDSIGGKASGTTSTLGGLFNTSTADVTSHQGQLEVQGNVQPPCFG